MDNQTAKYAIGTGATGVGANGPATTDAAEDNRRSLRAAGVFCVSLFGGPGCGKTTLLDRTIERLSPVVRAGAIVRNGRAHRERDLLSARRRNVIEVNPAAGTGLEAGQVQDALAALDLDSLELLLIENDVSMSRSGLQADLGQEATVAVFSVAAGDDKAYRHPEMIQSADAVVLNKLDLMRCVPFDDGAFTADVERVKPSVKFFPLSALHARGLEPWLTWLQLGVRKSRHTNEDASHWFG